MVEKVTCLLVDDDEDDREFFKMALQDTGISYDYTTAINGEDALQKLSNKDSFLPDFIFLDLNMPVMSGKHCLRLLKEIPRLQAIPVIIYSTSSYIKDIEETRQLGAAHFFTKPSSTDDISKMLRALFKKEPLAFSLLP